MAFEDKPGGFDGLGAVGAEGEVASVVEEKVGAKAPAPVTGDTVFEMCGDAGRGDVRTPVETHGVPENSSEAEVARGAEDVGATRAMRRAKEADRGAEDVLKSRIAAGQLLADAAGADEREPGMGDGVVADEVAGGLDLANEAGALANVACDEEERGADSVLREEIEEASGPGVVGAVIVGQRELGGIAAGDEGAAEELRLRAQRRVRASGESGRGAGCGESDEHLEPV